MDTSVHNESNRTYGCALLAALATAALVSVTFLTFGDAADAESQALFDCFAFLLRLILFVPLFALTPALWARSAWRTHPAVLGVLTLIAFVVGAAFGGMLPGLCAAGMIAPAGVFLYAAQRMKLSNFKIVFYGSIVMLTGLFIRISVPTMFSDGDAFLPMRALVDAYRTLWDEMTVDLAGLDDAGVASILKAMSESFSELKLNANEYMIELLYMPAALAALANGLFSHAFNRKGGADLTPLPPFADWMVEPAYFYGALALSLASYFMMLSGQEMGNALVRVAFVLWELPMALAGLCTLKKWTKNRSWIFIIVIVAAVTMPNMILQGLSLVGMFGFMRMQMQKRMQGGKQ